MAWSRLEASALCEAGPSPVIGTFVINMDIYPERFARLAKELDNQVCGFDASTLHRWPGVVASAGTLVEPWARELIPGLSRAALGRLGSLGLSLAHLSVWDHIGKLPECQASADRYVVVLEDDESLLSVFMLAVRRIIEQLPAGVRADVINFNILRPLGKAVPGMNLSWLFTGGALLEVTKYRKRHMNDNPMVKHPRWPGLANVWLSAYAVRCGSARALVREVGGYWNFTGASPVFDRAFMGAAVDIRTNFTLYVLERDMISKHVEGNDARKKRDHS